MYVLLKKPKYKHIPEPYPWARADVLDNQINTIFGTSLKAFIVVCQTASFSGKSFENIVVEQAPLFYPLANK